MEPGGRAALLILEALMGPGMGARTPRCLPEPPDHPEAFVVAGMGAPFAAIVRALTGIVLMVEMIDSYAHTLPFCVACGAAYAVAVQGYRPDTVDQPPLKF
jgi:H+/Cl- antiporter ClcA